MVNNIKNNAISEISAKKCLNTLNEIKNAGIIKYKKCTPGQKELLNLFNNLSDTILTDKTLMSSKDKNEKENENENDETLMSSKNDNENENENKNDKTLMSSNEDDDDYDDNDDDEIMSHNKKNEIIKGENDILDEIIDKSKSFEEQIKSLKRIRSKRVLDL